MLVNTSQLVYSIILLYYKGHLKSVLNNSYESVSF